MMTVFAAYEVPGFVAAQSKAEEAERWRRMMRIVAVTLLPLGAALIVAGSLWMARTNGGFGGYFLASLGVLVLVVGGLCGKFALVGPLPRRLREAGE